MQKIMEKFDINELIKNQNITKAIEKKLFDKFKDNIKGNFNIQDPSSIIKNKLLGI